MTFTLDAVHDPLDQLILLTPSQLMRLKLILSGLALTYGYPSGIDFAQAVIMGHAPTYQVVEYLHQVKGLF